MKKTLPKFLTVFILLFVLFLQNNSVAQSKAVHASNRKSSVVKCTSQLKDASGIELIGKYSSDIRSGKWIAHAANGFDFEFLVNEEATAISEFKLIFDDWTCGAVTHGGSIKITSTWPIANGEFTADISLGYNSTEKFLASGVFSENGTNASGNWSYESDWGDCSGTWTGFLENTDNLIVRVPEDFFTIQEGIDAANSGDTVLVAEGTYHENNIQMKAGVVVRGAGIDLSVVDGDSLTVFDGADNAVLEGFTITNASKFMMEGLNCWSSTTTVRNNKFTNCFFGVSVADNAVIHNNIFSGIGYSALFCGDYNPECKPQIKENLIVDNNIGISSVSSDIIVYNNTIHDNLFGIRAQQSSDDDTPVTISVVNNIISKNSYNGVYLAQSEEYEVDPSYVTITYNDVWDNSPDYSSNCEPDASNISEDPLFVSSEVYALQAKSVRTHWNDDGLDMAAYLNEAKEYQFQQNIISVANEVTGLLSNLKSEIYIKIDPANYHLKYNSPCIDAGDPDSENDPDGTRADMGAFYFDKGQDLPDLTATTGGFSPAEGGFGTKLNVEVTIENVGPGAADTSTVAFYLCKDPDVSVTDLLIGTAPVSALNTGEEESVEINYEIGENLPAGIYYIGYQLDYFNSVDETDDDNYYYLPEFTFTRLPDPDLVVSTMNFSPAVAQTGEILLVNIAVNNIDVGTSGPFETDYYLSNDTVISESDFKIGTSSASDLDGGQQSEMGITWTINTSLPDNEYYLGCVVDSKEQVNESNEENNSFCFTDNKFVKNDPPQAKSFSPYGLNACTSNSKPELEIIFSEPIEEGEGCLRIYQVLDDGSEILVRDKQCWEGKITGDTITFRLSLCLDSFAIHYVLIDEGFVNDLSGKAFEGIVEKSAWTFKTGNFPTLVSSFPGNKSIEIYPNPASNELNIKLINLKTPYTFELINIAGQLLVQKEYYSSFEKLDLNGLGEGIYLVKVYNSNFSKSEKLIIQ